MTRERKLFCHAVQQGGCQVGLLLTHRARKACAHFNFPTRKNARDALADGVGLQRSGGLGKLGGRAIEEQREKKRLRLAHRAVIAERELVHGPYDPRLLAQFRAEILREAVEIHLSVRPGFQEGERFVVDTALEIVGELGIDGGRQMRGRGGYFRGNRLKPGEVRGWVALVKLAVGDEGEKRGQGRVRVLAVGVDGHDRALARGQHHHAHDALGVDAASVAR